MKYYNFLFVIAVLASSLSPINSFATSYPATCPAEAQAIVEAVGGCSAVDPNQYGQIYEKCCSIQAISSPQSSLEPTPVIIVHPPGFFEDETSSAASAWFWVIISAGLSAAVYLKIWRKFAVQLRAMPSGDQRREMLRKFGFIKFVLVAGIILFGNTIVAILSAFLLLDGSFNTGDLPFLYIGFLVIGLFFGLILWFVMMHLWFKKKDSTPNEPLTNIDASKK